MNQEAANKDSYVFSVIIPAYREQERINILIDHLKSLGNKKNCEIIVVDGDAAQTTTRSLTRTDVTVISSPPGRGVQMNAGAAIAQGKILVFLHADTTLPDNAFAKMEAVINNEYVGGAFDLKINSQKYLLKVVSIISSLRSRLTRVPYGDQVHFVRRDYFNEMYGYRDLPLMEDVEFMKRIKKKGDKIDIIHDHVLTSDRRWQKEGIVYGTVRDWMLIILYLCGVSPQRLARWYPVVTD